MPLHGTQSARISANIPPMQFGRVKPDPQLHAPRVCFAYIEPILFPRKWQEPVLRLSAASGPSSRPVPAIEVFMPELANSGKTGTGSRARTYDLRFWRPPLYQLSYARTCRRASSAQHGLPKDFRGVCKEWSARCFQHSQAELHEALHKRPSPARLGQVQASDHDLAGGT